MLSGWFTPCFALGHGSALHPRCRYECLHSELQSEISQIFLLAEKSLDPTSRAVVKQHTSFGPGVRADSGQGGLTRTQLATDHQGFCARLVHSSITEDVKNLAQLCCSRSAEGTGSLFSRQHESCGCCSASTCSSAFWDKASSSG